MSFWSNLNPFEWIRKLLIGNTLGRYIRHALTAIGAILVEHGIVDAAQASSLSDALYPVAMGLISLIVGLVSSQANKTEVAPPTGSKAAKLAQPVAHL